MEDLKWLLGVLWGIGQKQAEVYIALYWAWTGLSGIVAVWCGVWAVILWRKESPGRHDDDIQQLLFIVRQGLSVLLMMVAVVAVLVAAILATCAVSDSANIQYSTMKALIGLVK